MGKVKNIGELNETDDRKQQVLGLDDTYRLFYMLLRARDIVLEAREKELAKFDLRPRHAAVIRAIKRLGNKATSREIANTVFRKPNSVSVMLTRMEKNGLILKKKAPEGGNRIIITLTPKGEKAHEWANETETLQSIFSGLSPEQRQQMEAGLWMLCINDLNDDAYRLFYILLRARDIVLEAREKELDKFGLRSRQAAVIIAIKNLGNTATPGEIANTVFRKPNSVSVMLTRMQKNGLILKKKAPEGGNRIIVTLTPKGEQAYEKASGGKSLQRVFSGLSQTQRRQMESGFRTLWENGIKELRTHSPSIFPFE